MFKFGVSAYKIQEFERCPAVHKDAQARNSLICRQYKFLDDDPHRSWSTPGIPTPGIPTLE